ncbi:terminase large subunit [Mesorhizobium sp.]|uniref:terminase large subunit domain-containing protein n=1 Tax=Mesorhizobium sp. TaxID=1871066 RepID=UPI000FE70FEC|nr:terminase large subunit [Mesorhizobium sp.]RWN59624.1 MAG: terminase [Mesorhizobium sp.]
MSLENITIDKALRDPNLLGAALGASPTWAPWIAVLRAAFALPMTESDLATFKQVAGGRDVPETRIRELWAIVGRRSGKSRMAAAVAAYTAFAVDHSKLSPGEVGTVLVLAASKAQANAVFRYTLSFFESSPILSGLIENTTSDEIRLSTGIVIAVHSSSYRTVRGRSLVACIFDEVAFWRDESSSAPDVETFRAVIPALATTKGMLIGISSPYRQAGLLYSKFQDAYGQNVANVLVVKAGTSVFNPTIDQTIIDQAHREDPESASAEWDAEFRGDLSNYIDRRVVEACIEPGVFERGYVRDYRYTAFCDPSSGASDSMTLAISHREGARAVLDCLREVKAPFSPTDVVNEFAAVLKAYQCTSVKGDAYAVGWVKEAFDKVGIRYVPSERNRSEIYLDALPALMGRSAVLLDNPRLVGQISQLERRTMRSGRDAVDHMRGMSDDLANAALGAIVNAPNAEAAKRTYYYGPKPKPVFSDPLSEYR